MADFPHINKAVCLPVVIPVFPYLLDHRFEGKAVLPAVEGMRVLARAVNEFAPETDVTAAVDTTFDKFLFIPSNTQKIDARCRITASKTGDITAVLETKTRAENAGFSRIKAHVTAHYPRIRTRVAANLHHPRSFAESDCLQISPDQIYRDLVPFGRAYQNVSENLTLHKDGAIAKLRAPVIGDAIGKAEPLGSPFVLDAAFHTASVWGQRYSGVVAFPVGVEKRIIVNPTRPGDTYVSTAVPVRVDSNGLIFDIWICDADNTLYEMALGVHMRDVSAGRMKPPAWMTATGGKL